MNPKFSTVDEILKELRKFIKAERIFLTLYILMVLATIAFFFYQQQVIEVKNETTFEESMGVQIAYIVANVLFFFVNVVLVGRFAKMAWYFIIMLGSFEDFAAGRSKIFMVGNVVIVLLAMFGNYLVRSVRLSLYLASLRDGDPTFIEITFTTSWIVIDRTGDYLTAIAPYSISAYLLFIVSYFANPVDQFEGEEQGKLVDSEVERPRVTNKNDSVEMFGSINSGDEEVGTGLIQKKSGLFRSQAVGDSKNEPVVGQRRMSLAHINFSDGLKNHLAMEIERRNVSRNLKQIQGLGIEEAYMTSRNAEQLQRMLNFQVRNQKLSSVAYVRESKTNPLE